jgi:hypothetical protein
MDSLNLCWRGQTQSGKKQQLHKALQELAALRKIPFSIQTKQFYTQGLSKSETGQITTTVEEDVGDGGSEKDSFPYEFSLLHVGFDIARMSMQDKIYLKPILQRWGSGSQVLAGNQGRGSRIIVFYHAHLFSTESYFLLHSVLENNYGDMSIWLTSELPIAERLSDYFIEIPVGFDIQKANRDMPSWPLIFEKLLKGWSQKPFPCLQETNEIRALLYELLMRNLRWTDCVHYLLDIVLDLPLEEEKRKAVLSILAKQEATAAGQTIPSYRIPLLWEGLFLQIREAISMDSSENEAGIPSGSEEVSTRSEGVHATATTKVVVRQSKPRRSKSDACAGGKQ